MWWRRWSTACASIRRPTPVPDQRRPEKPLWEQWADQSAALPQGERLQKVLAGRGWGSRRVCEELIDAGRVTVNGEVARLGLRQPCGDPREEAHLGLGAR